jgi:hypothetical protein
MWISCKWLVLAKFHPTGVSDSHMLKKHFFPIFAYFYFTFKDVLFPQHTFKSWHSMRFFFILYFIFVNFLIYSNFSNLLMLLLLAMMLLVWVYKWLTKMLCSDASTHHRISFFFFIVGYHNHNDKKFVSFSRNEKFLSAKELLYSSENKNC